MSNIIEDTENTLILAIVLLFIGVLVWVLWKYKDFFGLGSDAGGQAQSIKNVAAGFPDGADPGTVPALQYVQGIAESFRNFHDYVLGKTDGPEDIPADGGTLIDSYSPPASSLVQQAVTQAPGSVVTLLQNLQSNPGSLPMF